MTEAERIEAAYETVQNAITDKVVAALTDAGTLDEAAKVLIVALWCLQKDVGILKSTEMCLAVLDSFGFEALNKQDMQ